MTIVFEKIVKVQSNLVFKLMRDEKLDPEVAQRIAQDAMHGFLTSDLVSQEVREYYGQLGEGSKEGGTTK